MRLNLLGIELQGVLGLLCGLIIFCVGGLTIKLRQRRMRAITPGVCLDGFQEECFHLGRVLFKIRELCMGQISFTGVEQGDFICQGVCFILVPPIRAGA